MVRPIVTWLGSLASVLGLAKTLWPTETGVSYSQAVALTVLAVVFLFALCFDLWEHWKRRPHKYKSPEKINDYMFRWIYRGGRVVVFTRDMSWAQDRRIENLLLDKAKRNELSICLPQPIELTQKLSAAGAEIFTYENVEHIPLSRFTIINDGRMDASVAIGRQINGTHVIEEFAVGQHPVFAVAKDLTDIIRGLAK